MLKIFFKTAFRQILKNKLFSLINISGLAIGIAGAILILLWIGDELSYDQHQENISDLYRVMEDQYYSAGDMLTTSSTPGPMAPKMKDDFPEIIYGGRLTWEMNVLLNHEDKSLYFDARYVDQDFVDMFSYDLIEGDLSSAFTETTGMIITRSVSEALFGQDSPLGKMVKVDNDHIYSVKALIENIPSNTSVPFELLVPLEPFLEENTWANQWYNNNIRTFLRLQPGTDYLLFADKIKNYLKENSSEDDHRELFLQPMAKMRLYSDFRQGKKGGGRILYVRIFTVVGIFIIAIAAINFMNLATALSTKRAKEVGIRKVAGSTKRNLILQYLLETMMISGIALLLSLLIVYLVLPIFNSLTDKSVGLDRYILGLSLILTIITGGLAGIYPAFYIARYQPVAVLKGELSSGTKASFFRRSLVVFQFALSIILIIGTMVVMQQLNYILNKNIGLEKDNIVYVPLRENMLGHYEAIRNQMFEVEGIKNITVTSQNPIRVGNSTMSVVWPGKSEDDQVLFTNFFVDHDFVETFNIEMLAGRDFDRSFTNDSSNFLINESSAAAMGYSPDSIINQEITFWNSRVGRIVGVMKDFNFYSLHNEIDPLIILMDKESYFLMHLHVEMTNLENILDKLREIQGTYAPNYPFEYHFLDESWEETYQSEKMIGSLFNYFAFIAIFISCMGLYGLAAYSIERRTKELGIRKALGASLGNILHLVSKEYFLLIIIAFTLASPISWYAMNTWLIDFAYHIEISIFVFLAAVFISLFLALATVSFFAFKAARTNPVEVLRYE